MAEHENNQWKFRCQCGQVEIHAHGKPMSTVVCYCDDCQTGARYVENLHNAPRVLNAQGGTSVTLFPRHRVTYTKGKELLRPHKNRETTATNRNVASCCNTLMSADFDNWIPWITLYEHSAAGNFPDKEMHIYTKFSPAREAIPQDLPSYKTFPISLPWKIVKTAIAVQLGRQGK